MNDYLIKRKKEILFPYLPFINKMLMKVKGTEFEKRWEVMYECITSDRKRMTLEQIHKMDQTLINMKNNLNQKEEKKNERFTYNQQSPWQNQPQASTSRQNLNVEKLKIYRNPSPPPSQFSSSHHATTQQSSYQRYENNERNSAQHRLNDRRVNESYSFNTKQISPTSSSKSSYYDSRLPQNRSYDNHRSQGRFDNSRNFNYNKYHTSTQRPYERSQSRPVDNFRGRDRNNYFKLYERSKSKPFERSKSRPSEEIKKDNQQPTKIVNVDDNFLLTHPKFAKSTSKATVVRNERNSTSEKSIDIAKTNIQTDKTTETLKRCEVKENKIKSATISKEVLKLHEDEKIEKKICDAISSTVDKDIVIKKYADINSNVSEKLATNVQKDDETEQNLAEVSLDDDIKSLQSNEVSTTDNKEQSLCVQNTNTLEELMYENLHSENDKTNIVDNKEPLKVVNDEEIQHQTISVSTFNIENKHLIEESSCVQKNNVKSIINNEISIQESLEKFEQQSVENKQQDQDKDNSIEEKGNEESINNEIKTDLIEECSSKNEKTFDDIEKTNELEKVVDDSGNIMNDATYRSDSDISDVEEEPEIIVNLWEKMSKSNSNTTISSSPNEIKAFEKIIKIEPGTEGNSVEVKKMRKKKNELEKLQDDLSRTIDRDSFIQSSIKPRSCTLSKVNDNKAKLKICSVPLVRLNLTLNDMPVNVSDFESKYLYGTKKISSKVKKDTKVTKKKNIKSKSTAITSLPLLPKIKLESKSSNTIITFEKISEPVRTENINQEKRKSSIEYMESSIPKKPKLHELEEEWEDCPINKNVFEYKSSMNLKKFKKYFDHYVVDYDKKNPEILKIRKLHLNKAKNRRKTKIKIGNNREPILNENASEELIEEKKKDAVSCPPLMTLQNKIHTAPIIIRKTPNKNISEIKYVAVKPKDVYNKILSCSTLTIKPSQKPSDVKSLVVPSTSKTEIDLESQIKTSSQASPVNVSPATQSSNNQSSLIVTPTVNNNMPSSSSSISSASSEQSGRVEKIPITLPSAQTEQQDIEVIDISDEDDEDNVTSIDILRPWIEQSKFKSKKNSKACKIMRNKFCLSALYKCMGSTCCFYTSEKNYFQIHLELHCNHQKEDASNYLLCSYCEHRAKDIGNLISHINLTHGSSIFSCNYCFYRSHNEFQVTMNHFQKYHVNEEKRLIVFNPPYKREKNHDLKHVRQTISQYCQQLTCIFCSKNFYVISTFLDHIKIHSEKIFSKCIKCGKTADATNIISHYFNCYGFGLFQCVYCNFGTATLSSIDNHLSNKHPDRVTYFASRNITENSNVRKNPSDISCLSLKEINKESTDDTRFEKIFVSDSKSMTNSKNLGNLSDEQMESSEEEKIIMPTTCSLMIENVLSLNTNNSSVQ